jgi:hypothetical protein
MYAAFLDELHKIAASRGRMRVPQSRSGRRPMRVDTMLKKEKDGSLFKDTKIAAAFGTNSAGYKLQGKTDVRGIPIAIENRKGSVREGTNDDGTKWKTKYKVPYGYIEGTKGADGDEIDAYVGGDRDADEVYVVRQKDDKGKYDEDTVMLGFRSKAKAKKAILDHYDDPKYIGRIMTVALDRFREMLGKANGKKLTKIAVHQGSDQHDSLARPAPQVGKPAKRKKKVGDVPDLDNPEDYPKTEQVQTNQATTALVPAISGGGYY